MILLNHKTCQKFDLGNSFSITLPLSFTEIITESIKQFTDNFQYRPRMSVLGYLIALEIELLNIILSLAL